MILFGDSTFHNTHVELHLKDGLTTSYATYYRKVKLLCGVKGCYCPITWHDLSGRFYFARVVEGRVQFEIY